MRRRIVAIAAAALAIALVVPGPVLATKSQTVTFESPWFWGTTLHDEFTGGTSPICASGDVYTVAKFAGGPNNPSLRGWWRKLFVCADGGATFSLQLEGRITLGPPMETTFTWVVLAADGYLAGLHGTGTGYSNDITDVGGTDHYTGQMHID
jgi:hypothetical protein